MTTKTKPAFMPPQLEAVTAKEQNRPQHDTGLGGWRLASCRSLPHDVILCLGKPGGGCPPGGLKHLQQNSKTDVPLSWATGGWCPGGGVDVCLGKPGQRVWMTRCLVQSGRLPCLLRKEWLLCELQIWLWHQDSICLKEDSSRLFVPPHLCSSITLNSRRVFLHATRKPPRADHGLFHDLLSAHTTPPPPFSVLPA